MSKRRNFEQRVRAADWQRNYNLERRQAQLHRCDGCGTWLYAQRPCTACPAIAAERAERAAKAWEIAS